MITQQLSGISPSPPPLPVPLLISYLLFPAWGPISIRSSGLEVDPWQGGEGEENDELVELYSVFHLFPIWQMYFFIITSQASLHRLADRSSCSLMFLLFWSCDSCF